MDGSLPFIADSLVNLVSELGTEKSKSEHGRFARRGRMTRYECEAIYDHNWLGGKIIDAPADDATREWRAWSGSKPVVEALEATERRLKLPQTVNLTLKRAARDGGAAILIGTADDPTTPFNPKAVGRDGLLYLTSVSRWSLSTGDIDRDPMSPWFGQATSYRMMMPRGEMLTIHPSRVILFVVANPGDPLETGEPWGFSLYERLREPMRDVIAAFQGVSALMQEAKIDVVSIPGLTKNVANDRYRGAVLQRFGLANMIKSINNALLLDSEETWEQKTLSFGGYPEILDRLLYVVAGAADMPVTKLIGRSPAGLTSTGVSDLEHYYTLIRSRQETILRPILEPLDDALIRSALGRVPRGVGYDWRSLWSQSDGDKAEVRLKHSQAVKGYADTGLFDHVSLAKAAATVMEENDFLYGVLPAESGPLAVKAGIPTGAPSNAPAGVGGGAARADPTQATQTDPVPQPRTRPTTRGTRGEVT